MNTVYKQMIKPSLLLPRSGKPHISRAASRVGVMYHVSGPNTGRNPRGGRILNKKKLKTISQNELTYNFFRELNNMRST